MSTFLLVLRGRPGLGHVIPGLTLARELRSRGHRARVLTYSNGIGFLERSGWDDWEGLEIAAGYSDWPGLHPYDHGLRDVARQSETVGADFLVLGGEYLLASLGRVFGLPCALLFNPEILEAGVRNRLPGRLFGTLFEDCDLLVPLLEPATVDLSPAFARLANRFTPPGPFPFGGGGAEVAPRGEGLVVLLANGGGVALPDSTASYADAPIDPRRWVKDTRQSTLASVRAALDAAERGDRVVLFSCLGEDENRALKRELAAPQGILTVHSPSTAYFDVLAGADVVVSRAGAGFLADTVTTGAEVVLWTLKGHEEQALNARRLRDRRPRTRFAKSLSSIRPAVAAAMRAARRDPVDRAIDPEPSAARVIDCFEARIG